MQSSQAQKEFVQGMPVGILWINQGPTEATDELIKRIQREVPSAEVQRAEGEVALILAVPEAKANEGAALMKKAQRLWRWRIALRTNPTTPRGCPPKPLPLERTKQSRRTYTAPDGT
jgi:vacuolar-type H+-ATPase subunit F/Vma7